MNGMMKEKDLEFVHPKSPCVSSKGLADCSRWRLTMPGLTRFSVLRWLSHHSDPEYLFPWRQLTGPKLHPEPRMSETIRSWLLSLTR